MKESTNKLLEAAIEALSNVDASNGLTSEEVKLLAEVREKTLAIRNTYVMYLAVKGVKQKDIAASLDLCASRINQIIKSEGKVRPLTISMDVIENNLSNHQSRRML